MTKVTLGAPSEPSGIGAGFDPLHGEQLENPYPFYKRARREQPVFFSSMLQTWYVTGYEDIVAILNDSVRFSSDDLFDYSAVMPDPNQPSWQSQKKPRSSSRCASSVMPLEKISQQWIRRAINRALTGDQIIDLETRIWTIAVELINQFANCGRADFIREFAQLLPARVLFNVLGVPERDLKQMKRWETAWVASTSGQLVPEQEEKVALWLNECQQYWLRLIEERKANPRADLLSCLITSAQDEAAATDVRQIVNACTVISLAGHENVANLLGICLYRLLSLPDVWRLISQDKTEIPKAVEEILRFETSVPASMRTTTEEVEVHGVRIPRGSRVALLFASANRDETYFHDPDRFDLQREDGTSHLAFGRGIHFCLGAPVARLQARLTLELLIDRLPGLRLVSGQRIRFAATPAHRGLKELLIEWDADDKKIRSQ
jgi:cytochrome P450